MKAFLFGLLFLALVLVGGFVWLKYFYTSVPVKQTYTTESITKTGVVQKTTIAQSDFTHVLVSTGASVGVASYSLNLDDYIGKNVTITGQYSGNTLFADTIVINP